MIVDLATFTIIHTALSLLALAAGCIVIAGLLGRAIAPHWPATFLVLALATSITGFMFPFKEVTPAFATGIVAMIVLAAALIARYVTHYAGIWRGIYAAAMVTSAYLLAFVTVVQSFLKLPALTALAPTGTEPPFAVAQIVVLAIFVWLGWRAVKRFRPTIGAINSMA